MAEPIDPDEWRLLKKSLADLARRVTRLEQAVGARGVGPASAATPSAAADEEEFAPVTVVSPTDVESEPSRVWLREAIERTRAASAAPTFTLFDSKESLERLIGGRWFTWLGAGSLALAVAFFVPWAWRHFELPAWVRVLIFHLAGMGVLGGSYALSRKRLPVLAHGLAGLGIFMLYASAFAMEYHYHLWGAYGTYATLVDCALITAAAIAIAIRANSVYIVGLGALGGYVTPLVSARGPQGFTATFIYLAFLNAALLVTATIRPWRFLKPMAVAATAAMFLIWIYGTQPRLESWRVEWMLVLHAALYLVGTTAPPLFGQRSQSVDLAALAGNSLWFVGGTWLVFHYRIDQQMAAVCWGMSALHAVLFGLIYRRLTNADRMPRVHLALAAVFFTLAVPLQMRDTLSYLAYAWAVEGFVFTAMGVYFRDRQMTAAGGMVLFLAAGRALAFDFVAPPETIGTSAVDRRMLVVLGVGLAMVAAGSCYWWVARLARPSDESPPDRKDGALLMAVGNIVALFALTRQWDGRIVLLLWTLDAAMLWAAAFWRHESVLRGYALFVSLALVGGRMLYHGASLTGPFELLTNERLLSLALVAALYLVAGWFERRRRRDSPAPDELDATNLQMDALLHVVGNVVLLVALSLEAHDLWQGQGVGGSTWRGRSMEEKLTYSVLWAAYAAVLVAVGFALKYRLPRLLGLGGLLAVACKVVIIDLADILLIYRVLILAVLGGLLLITSFWYQKFTARIESTQPE